jgi:hypothetical protein
MGEISTLVIWLSFPGFETLLMDPLNWVLFLDERFGDRYSPYAINAKQMVPGTR